MVVGDQERVVVVLVRARNPANIGAVARAMHDLGFSRLRVVNEYAVPFQAALAAERAAVDAATVLQSASEHRTVAEAVADCTLVLGTTAVGERTLEHEVETLAVAGRRVGAALAGSSAARVALLFGSEKTGLSNEELSHCHGLLTIPMNTRGAARHLSMNLGQAAAVCLYELTREAETEAAGRVEGAEEAATAGEIERLTGLLAEALDASGYTRRHPANARGTSVRRLVRRMGATAADAQVWTGILRQMLHGLRTKAGDD